MEIFGEEQPYNTDPMDYVVDLSGLVRQTPVGDYTPSKRVILALQQANQNIKTIGFRKHVTDAIFDDAVEQNYPIKDYRDKLIRRLDKWTKNKSKKVLLEKCEILEAWRKRNPRFVPDAYLIDKERRAIICFEIEDWNHISPFKIFAYGVAWWALEYIYWDIHLIAYDIYGNYRVVSLPESDFLARELRAKRNPPPA